MFAPMMLQQMDWVPTLAAMTPAGSMVAASFGFGVWRVVFIGHQQPSAVAAWMSRGSMLKVPAPLPEAGELTVTVPEKGREMVEPAAWRWTGAIT